MKKDEVWEMIRKDKAEVYGEPMLDMFLKTASDLEPRHYKELGRDQRGLLRPEVRLRNAETAEDVKRSIREMGSNDPQYAFDRKKIALKYIAKAGNEEAMDFLMKDLEESDVIDRDENSKEDLARVVMLGAASGGNKELIRKYLDMGFELNLHSFYSAASEGHTELLSWLDKQVGEQKSDLMGYCLQLAVEGGRDETMNWIMDKYPSACSHTLVGHAVRVNRLNSAKYLLKNAKFTPEKRKMALDEALLVAAGNGRPEAVEWLLKMGAGNLDKALLKAALFDRQGHLNSARMLIDAGATELEAALYITRGWVSRKGMQDFLSKEIAERKERKRNAPGTGGQP
jgi:hypothetical protein